MAQLPSYHMVKIPPADPSTYHYQDSLL